MAARHLYLIRHGQYHLEDGEGADVDGSLTGVGREQAHHVTEALSSLPVSTVYCSPLRRALETAEFVASGFKRSPVVVEELREVIPVIPPDLADFFAENMPDLTPEKVAAGHALANQAFQRFFIPPDADEDQHEILVCHGNLIQYLACRVIGAPADLWLRLETHQCSIARCVVGHSGRMKLVSLNDIGHLPAELRFLS